MGNGRLIEIIKLLYWRNIMTTKVDPEDCTGCKLMNKISNKVYGGIILVSVITFVLAYLFIPNFRDVSAKVEKTISTNAKIEKDIEWIKKDLSEIKEDFKKKEYFSEEQMDGLLNALRRSIYGARDDILNKAIKHDTQK
jgi:hypothetical protein